MKMKISHNSKLILFENQKKKEITHVYFEIIR